MKFQDFIDKGHYIERAEPAIVDTAGGRVIKNPKIPARFRSMMRRPGGFTYDGDRSRQDSAVVMALLNAGYTAADVYATFAACPRGKDALERKNGHFEDYVHRTIAGAQGVSHKDAKDKAAGSAEAPVRSDEALTESDGTDWRTQFKTRNQLNRNKPEYLVEYLLPSSAFTIITAPSYNAKTWFAMQMGWAIANGSKFVNYFGTKKAPVRYHVPEMNEAFVRERMDKLRIKDTEDFMVRAMEGGPPLILDEPWMVESSRGAVVFLDTMGYFNEAEDASSYTQAIKFSRQVHGLIQAGALAVIGLYHPPKMTSSGANGGTMSLENMVLGSAGYGGMLRSCIAIKNLNPDLNSGDVWLYVQGLKNPGLSPFQLDSIPLRMRARPGKSEPLDELLKRSKKIDSRMAEAFHLFASGANRNDVCKTLKISATKEYEWRGQWKQMGVEDLQDGEILLYDQYRD
jgi:hypothetical protein